MIATRPPSRATGGRRRPDASIPWGLAIPAALGAALFVLPLIALLFRVPWSRVWAETTAPEVVAALRVSLVVSVSATAISLVLGVPLAWVQARSRLPGRSLLRAVTTLPIVFPPVVGGLVLLLAFGRNGVVGGWLESAFGIVLPFSTAGAVLAATFVSMPFLVLSMEGAFESLDGRHEAAAGTLGASPRRVFWRVVLPMVRPSLVAGLVLTWARALGEFGATITFAGNFPGRTQTLPLATFLALERDPGSAIVLGLLLVAVSVAIVFALRRRIGGLR